MLYATMEMVETPPCAEWLRSALEMRLLSIKLTEGGGNEIEEPITGWDFANKQPAEQLPVEIRSWLFRRRY